MISGLCNMGLLYKVSPSAKYKDLEAKINAAQAVMAVRVAPAGVIQRLNQEIPRDLKKVSEPLKPVSSEARA